jgi:hypothetical protein
LNVKKKVNAMKKTTKEILEQAEKEEKAERLLDKLAFIPYKPLSGYYDIWFGGWDRAEERIIEYKVIY